jgi:hypothetical protein
VPPAKTKTSRTAIPNLILTSLTAVVVHGCKINYTRMPVPV